ncbi:uncharacterized protein I303_100987 [Kwoniella dejecticola CBS 10117]|uniref:SET domain-containing protein n=1 Tax=Kwoniella dejecticola CBS 10117 TaxID=1296121 RepID=A0A1A6AGH1_9TREE|nr:uncharacterized protein I303_00992 [Kwoniella dejecticola CBS 10117]OBR89169.1 hypothetical protein I303_00992 [Kwoniella dejecticola CBS 10117]
MVRPPKKNSPKPFYTYGGTKTPDSSKAASQKGSLPKIAPKLKPVNPDEHAIRVLHQLCAFEQMFHDLIAVRDGVHRAPMRASLDLEMSYDGFLKRYHSDIRQGIKHSPSSLQKYFHTLTTHQVKQKDNIVPRKWLDLIETSFSVFASRPTVKLGINNGFDSAQIGLFADSNRSGGTCVGTGGIEGIRFVVFAFPESVHSVGEAGFEEGLTFEHNVEGKDITLIGLGPARTINRSCYPNVYWYFKKSHLNHLSGSSVDGIGYSAFPIRQVAGVSIRPGDELTAFYSEHFAEYLCDCRYPMYHQRGVKSAESKEENSTFSSSDEDDQDSSEESTDSEVAPSPKAQNIGKRKETSTVAWRAR